MTKRFDDAKVEAAFKELQPSCGGVKEDYFGLLYLEREFRVSREEAILQNAFNVQFEWQRPMTRTRSFYSKRKILETQTDVRPKRLRAGN